MSTMHSKQQNNSNYPSLLLNQSQNNLVFSLLGKRCYTLATAVVQLVLTEPSSLNKWSLKTTGVVCFVKDHPKKSYFIKVYDCDKRTLTWQQEIYPSFQYRTPRPYFHTFEAHDCIVGLNFASEQEAQLFRSTILGKLKDREKKRTDRLKHNGNDTLKTTPSSYGNNNNISIHDSGYNKHQDTENPAFSYNMNNSANRQNGSGLHLPENNIQAHRLQHTVSARLRPTQSGVAASIPVSTMQKSQSVLLGNLNNNLTSIANSTMKSEKKKLNKRDISTPFDFQHVTHVGFSPQTGFDLENVNPSMKRDLQKFFTNPDQQGQAQPCQPESPQYLAQIHHAQQSPHHQANPPPPPPPPPPPVPPMPSPAMLNKPRAQSTSSNHSTLAKGLQDRSLANGNSALQPPPVPPPPPPRPLPPMPNHTNTSKPKPLIHINNQTTTLVEKPVANGEIPSSAAPPPPPPPPPPPLPPPGGLLGATPKISGQTVKASTPAPPKASSPMDMHAALMSQVLKGRQLNHVDPAAEKSPHPSSSANSQDDPRTALMNQIKAGVKLKTVSSKQNKPTPAAQPVGAGGLAGALAKALQERSKVLQQTDESQSSSSDEGEDDDEWDES